ncbi:MAG: phosphotransferase [Anaerolineae bacterium]|nr:phosphotransferase [Anaerolineae bacterium]
MRSEAVITRLEQITAEWLTGILTRNEALTEGHIAALTLDVDARELSTSVRLRVEYTAGAAGARPEKLFLKMVNADMEVEFFGPSEVNYYVRDYVGVPDVPIPRCYDAAYSPELRRYHVLLDDLADTHFASWNRPPTLEHGRALAEGLAALHAHWWDAERLASAGEPIHDAAAIRRFVSIAEPGAGHIINACADQLQSHWPQSIYTLYAQHPARLIDRTRDANGFTLIHGDTNLSNILIPINGDRPLYIVDRQPFDWSLTTWLGVYDLAYTMVLKWDAELRRALEKPVLEHYHAHLLARGIRGYSWEQLWQDYRLCAPMAVYVATEWCRGGLNRDTMDSWLPMLQRAMTAVDDLRCAELWA